MALYYCVFHALCGAFRPWAFFVLGFIGFLMIMELLEPRYVRPAYLRYTRFLTFAGIVIAGLVIAQKVMEVLGLYFTWSF